MFRPRLSARALICATICCAGIAAGAAHASADDDPSPRTTPAEHERSDPPTTDFLRDVMPVLNKAGCTGGKCHGSFQGRGGFQLSLFGFNPQLDYEALVKQARGRRLSLAAPDASLALRKPLGELPHGGGIRFREGEPAHRILRTWIARGAPDAADDDLHIERLEVTPSEVILQPGQHRDLHVTAHWSDGVVRDVTSWAIYEVREDKYAEASPAGRVEALEPGRTSITVVYMGAVAAIPVTVPYGQLSDTLDFPAANYIDEHVAREWSKLGIRPAALCDDTTFIRRVYLDVIGTMPRREQIESFTASTDENKRAKLIDQLLERGEYVDHWATKWGDLLRVHRRYVGDKGLWTFWGWLRQSMRENKPADELTRELLTSTGSLYSNGATAYYYVDQKPEELAETTSQLFLGVRLQCARCHHHPYEIWSQEDYYGLANFFTRIELKDNQDNGRYGGAKLLKPVTSENRDRRAKMRVEPKVFGHQVDVEQTGDVRKLLADWITADDNPYFAKNIANRYWSYFLGRGLVEPVDDLRATNPASHPELLDALAADLVAHDYDVKHLIRTICNSRIYQLASEVTPTRDQDGMFYTHHRYQRLPAAVLLDAVNQATGVTESFDGLPAGTRAISLPDPAIPSYFLDSFGRSVRANPCECATSTAPDLSQALHLINSPDIDKKISSSGGRLARLLGEKKSDAAIVEELYFATLCRGPSEAETSRAVELVAAAPSKQIGFEDLFWTLLNSTEFVFNH
ncbi:MAG: DUF1549 domain-containing protein [Pirellulaceae bacterium]